MEAKKRVRFWDRNLIVSLQEGQLQHKVQSDECMHETKVRKMYVGNNWWKVSFSELLNI